MLDKIPHQRLVLYAAFAGFLPILFTLAFLFKEISSLNELETSLSAIEHEVFFKEKKQAVNKALRSYFKDADHFYIDKHLETLLFLEPEIEHLEKMIKGPLPVTEQIKKRYEYLTSPQNALSFSEGQVRSYPHFQETTETLIHPVEVNVADIQKILAKIEGVESSGYTAGPYRPHFIVTDFKIEKKQPQPNTEVFLLNLKLLKREYL